MFFRRILIICGICLVLFLAMYSWNRRTGMLDDFAANAGLELTAFIIKPWHALQDVVGDFWNRYFDLVDVRGENQRLKKRVDELEALLVAKGEDLAELERLRQLVQFPVDVRWRTMVARVLAGRMGPNAVFDSITISRGYANGARPGMPIVTNMGLAGRILRSSAHASIAMLLTDPGSKVAVFGQESRAAGILKGMGMNREMEVDFVQRNAGMKAGEVLLTSGLDEKYPKGLPVARVKTVAPSDYTQFMAVKAEPLVDFAHLEEVLILEKSGVELPDDEWDGTIPELVGPPLPEYLQRKRDQQNARTQANGSVSSPSFSPSHENTPAISSVTSPEEQPPVAWSVQEERAPRFRVITP